MLEDFDPRYTIDSAAKQRGLGALALATAGFGALATVLVLRSQMPSPAPAPEEVEVTFEAAPQPEETPEVTPPEPEQIVAPERFDARPAAVREVMQAPTEVPTERLRESDAELVPVGDSGPITGIVGAHGGTGARVGQALGGRRHDDDEDDDEDVSPRARHYSIEDATAPRLLEGCRAPSFPSDPTLVGQSVRVRCTVGVDGTPTCNVVSGPEGARGPALECAMSRRYEPARYPDGSATAYPKPITFIIGGS